MTSPTVNTLQVEVPTTNNLVTQDESRQRWLDGYPELSVIDDEAFHKAQKRFYLQIRNGEDKMEETFGQVDTERLREEKEGLYTRTRDSLVQCLQDVCNGIVNHFDGTGLQFRHAKPEKIEYMRKVP